MPNTIAFPVLFLKLISIGDPITRRKVGIPSNLFVLIPSVDFIDICRGFDEN
jgi:hypothetical protein